MILAAALVAGDGCGASNGEERSSSRPLTPFCDAVARVVAVKAAPPVNVAVDDSMSDAEIDTRVQQGREQLAAALAEADNALAALELAAPAALDADVAVVVAADRAYLGAIKATDFDMFAVASAGRVGDREVADAESRIDQHAQATCGFAFRRLATAEGLPPPPSIPPVPALPEVSIPVPPAPRQPAGEPADHPEVPVVDG